MSALQLSPISGVSATAAGASPAGDAAATPKSASSSKTAALPQPVAASASASQAAQATAADATAAAETARQDARIETPTLSLSVGLVGGTFDVYVDLTDATDNRVVARLYGPKGSASPPQHQAPTRVRTEA